MAESQEEILERIRSQPSRPIYCLIRPSLEGDEVLFGPSTIEACEEERAKLDYGIMARIDGLHRKKTEEERMATKPLKQSELKDMEKKLKKEGSLSKAETQRLLRDNQRLRDLLLSYMEED